MGIEEITKPDSPTAQPRFGPDVIYAEGYSAVPRFCFDEKVASVFPDMIRRSVPGYGTVLELLPALAENRLAPGDRVYDLGCSLGAGLLAISQALKARVDTTAQQPKIELIGVDNSAVMIQQAQAVFNHQPSIEQWQHKTRGYTIRFIQADVRQLALEPCRFVLLNYTLQFIPLEARDQLIQKIFTALQPGGRLLISEKLIDENPAHEALLADTHSAFKRSQGYSDLEIAQKRQALENVLIRETKSAHLRRLRNAGFNDLQPIAHCLQFHSFLAQKS